MQEGTIVDLFVKIGDQVRENDVIYEIETDKATLEVESPAAGFVKYIAADLGMTLQVGRPVMVLADKNEDLPQSLIDSLRLTGTAPADTQLPAAKLEPQTSHPDEDPAAAPAEPTPLSEIKLGDTIPLSRIQKITARKMLRSKREIPCFYLNVRADLTDLARLRNELNAAAETKISFNDLLMRALAISLQKFPIMTGSLSGDKIELPRQINIGLSVSAPQGLVVPVIKNIQDKTVTQITRTTADLIQKARTNNLRLTDLEDACITISNLGSLGVESFIPIVVPGQCSILGVGKITDIQIPQGPDHNTIRKFMTLTLAVDHRIANGAYAAQFLDFLRKTLEDTANFE